MILVYDIWNPNRISYKKMMTALNLSPCPKPTQPKPGTTSPIYALVPIKRPLVTIVPPGFHALLFATPCLLLLLPRQSRRDEVLEQMPNKWDGELPIPVIVNYFRGSGKNIIVFYSPCRMVCVWRAQLNRRGLKGRCLNGIRGK
jgi:hypothetical protein